MMTKITVNFVKLTKFNETQPIKKPKVNNYSEYIK